MRKPFTIIEILVVLVIITLLATLLLPVLNKSRETGKQAYCINNLKQLATTNHLYSSNFNYFVPGRSGDATYGQHWHGHRDSESDPWDASESLLKEYMGDKGEINKCPSIAIAEDIDVEEAPNMGNQGYGYNFNGVGSQAYILGYDDEHAWEAGMKPVEVKNHSKTIMFGDCAKLFSGKIVVNDNLITPYSLSGVTLEKLKTKKPSSTVNGKVNNESRIHFRHNKKANIAWVDGHVTSERLVFSWSPDGGDADDIERASKNIGCFGPKDNSLHDPWEDNIPDE